MSHAERAGGHASAADRAPDAARSTEGRSVTHPPTARRAVVLVANPAAPYSRGLRIARALRDEGYAVEIAAVGAPGYPDRERDGDVEIVRYPPTGRFARYAATHRPAAVPAAPAPPPGPGPGRPESPDPASRAAGGALRRVFRRILRPAYRRARPLALRTLKAVLWPRPVRGWWATLDRELPPADLYHACGSLAIAPALAAAHRSRREGRSTRVIYDAVDAAFEGNNVLSMPGPLRRWNARRERRWARRADARITVNDALADRLAAAWGGVGRPLVVPNYPDSRVPASGADPIRAATGLPPTTRVVLFQGRLSPNLGLDEAAEAVLRVPEAALVLVGFGRWFDRCRARDTDPRFAGRHFTLPAVHPDELPAWTASADVVLVPLPPVSLNQRLSTPNKFWEALAAGIPVVVGPGLEVMAELVREHDLGVVAASGDPTDLAAAIVEVVDAPEAARRARRERIAALAQSRFSWAAVAAEYRAFVREIAEPGR